MSHTIKLWKIVIEWRLRKEAQVIKNKFGFLLGRSTMEAIYLLRHVMKQYRMNQQALHLVFIDLEKTYDRVPKKNLWKVLERKGSGFHISELSKICMKGYKLVHWHGKERNTISSLQYVCTRVHSKPISFYFNLWVTRETHTRDSTEMHIF